LITLQSRKPIDTTNNRKVETTKINKQGNATTQQSCYSQMKVQQCHDAKTMKAKQEQSETWEHLVRAMLEQIVKKK
jgi:hypothetical protein